METHLHATRRCGTDAPEAPSERSRVDEATVDAMLRFEPAEHRSCEGKFAFLVAQKKHVLTPQVIVTLSTRKLNTSHKGYHRPKVPLMTIERPSEPNCKRFKFAQPSHQDDFHVAKSHKFEQKRSGLPKI